MEGHNQIAMDERLQPILEEYRSTNATVVALLQAIHDEYSYLPEEALRDVSTEVDIPLSTLYSLATFYATFRLEPMGKHHVCVCMGTACHVKGAEKLVETLERDLGVARGETTSDGEYTLDTVNCLGACALAPLVVADDEYYGKMDQKTLEKVRKGLSEGEAE